MVFQDSIQRIEGIESFKALCEELCMDIHATAQEGTGIPWFKKMYRKFMYKHFG